MISGACLNPTETLRDRSISVLGTCTAFASLPHTFTISLRRSALSRRRWPARRQRHPRRRCRRPPLLQRHPVINVSFLVVNAIFSRRQRHFFSSSALRHLSHRLNSLVVSAAPVPHQRIPLVINVFDVKCLHARKLDGPEVTSRNKALSRQGFRRQ